MCPLLRGLRAHIGEIRVNVQPVDLMPVEGFADALKPSREPLKPHKSPCRNPNMCIGMADPWHNDTQECGHGRLAVLWPANTPAPAAVHLIPDRDRIKIWDVCGMIVGCAAAIVAHDPGGITGKCR